MPEPLSYRSPAVQRLRRLLGRRAHRVAERAFVVEGAKLVAEALGAGALLEAVYLGAGWEADPATEQVAQRARAVGIPVHLLAPGVVERASDTVSPQPLLAVAATVDVALDALASASFVVVCIDVRDPGNLGTVLRVAEGAGVDGVICCRGSVDIYNPKTVRASAGALFGVPVVNGGGAREVLEQMGMWGMRRLGTRVSGGRPYDSVPLTGPMAIVLGNEAAGLDPDLTPTLDEQLTIPMSGRTGSLNVATAAAVLCFEASRQRRLAR